MNVFSTKILPILDFKRLKMECLAACKKVYQYIVLTTSFVPKIRNFKQANNGGANGLDKDPKLFIVIECFFGVP